MDEKKNVDLLSEETLEDPNTDDSVDYDTVIEEGFEEEVEDSLSFGESVTDDSRKRNGVKKIVVGLILLLAVVGIIALCGSNQKITGDFEQETATEFMVEGLTCYAPESWNLYELEKNDNYSEMYVSRTSEKDETEEDAYLVIRYYGQFDSFLDGFNVVSEELGGGDDAYDSVEVPGCSDAWNINPYSITFGDKKGFLCGRILYCKNSMFVIFGYASNNVFDEEEYQKMFDACDTENYIVKKLDHITAQYIGTPKAGDYISESSNITVTAHYNTGESEEVEGWTLEDSLILIAFADNKLKINYKDKSYTLNIPCTDAKNLEEYEEIPDFWVFDGDIRYDANNSELLKSFVSDSGVSEAYYYTIPSKDATAAVESYEKVLLDRGFTVYEEDGNVTNYLNRSAGLGIVFGNEKSTDDSSLNVVTIMVIEL